MIAPPLSDNQRPAGRFEYCSALLDVATVEIASVAIPTTPLATLTVLVVPKLKVGGKMAPAGLDVTDADNATLPVNPLLEVMVIIEVFPVVAPEATVTAVPLKAKATAESG